MERRIKVIFQWVPSHIGVAGNEKADQLAKESLQLDIIQNLSPTFSDVKNLLINNVQKSLEENWERNKRSFKLGKIKEKWEYWHWTNISNRKIEISMTRLRLGHCCLNYHLHRINISNSPNCNYCGEIENIEHFLLQCPRYYTSRIIMKDEINKIGIRNITKEVLLGGGNIDKDKKAKINKIVAQYLLKCNRNL